MGLHEGGEITIVSGTTINIEEGHGYIDDNSGLVEIYKRIEWVATGLTLPTSSDVYIYFNENGVLYSKSKFTLYGIVIYSFVPSKVV